MANKLNMTVDSTIQALDWAENNGTWSAYFGKMQHQWSGVEQELSAIRSCVQGKGREGKGDIDEERGQRFVDWWANNHNETPQTSGDVMVLCFLAHQRKGG